MHAHCEGSNAEFQIEKFHSRVFKIGSYEETKKNLPTTYESTLREIFLKSTK